SPLSPAAFSLHLQIHARDNSSFLNYDLMILFSHWSGPQHATPQRVIENLPPCHTITLPNRIDAQPVLLLTSLRQWVCLTISHRVHYLLNSPIVIPFLLVAQEL